MQLVRNWTRRAGAAAGASLLVPLVVILAATVVSFGGFGSLGALTDLVTGPEAPLGDVAATGVDALAEQPATLLGGGPSRADGAGGAGTGGPSGVTGGGSGGSGGGAGGGNSDGGDGDSGGGGDGDSGGGGGGGPGGDTPPGGGDDPDPPRDIVDDGRDVAEQLPGPVGPLTGEAIDGAIDATEGLLPRGALDDLP